MSQWVVGWSMELMLFVGGAVLLWHGAAQQGSTFIVGATIITVMRAIERDRRRREGPPPGSKV